VIAREAVLNDAEVSRLLREHFICVAIDNVDHPQLTPIEKAFVQNKGLKFCTQGMSTFTAGGKVLEMGGGFEADGVRPMLERAIAKFKPEENVKIPEPPLKDLLKLKHPPEGGLVCYVTWKVLGEFEAEGSPTTGDDLYAGVYRRTLGVDRLWIRADEAQALARGEVLESLQRRMMWHVDYVLAGEVEQADLKISAGKLKGSLQTTAGDRGHVQGFIAAQNGRVTRCDVLFTGLGEQIVDCGFSAGLTVIPKGKKLPVGVLFTLADPANDLSRTVPARANDENYLK
jgi:hypothetical protein